MRWVFLNVNHPEGMSVRREETCFYLFSVANESFCCFVPDILSQDSSVNMLPLTGKVWGSIFPLRELNSRPPCLPHRPLIYES